MRLYALDNATINPVNHDRHPSVEPEHSAHPITQIVKGQLK